MHRLNSNIYDKNLMNFWKHLFNKGQSEAKANENLQGSTTIENVSNKKYIRE